MRILLLFASMVFHAFFGVALMQSRIVVAADWYASLQRPWGGSALADQAIGGGLAWAFGELPSLVVLAALFFQWARSDEREQRRLDRAADRSAHDDAHEAYNRALRALADAETRSAPAVRQRRRAP